MTPARIPLLVATISTLFAAETLAAPNITTTSPGAVAPGATTTLVVRGQNMADVSQLWTSFAAEATVDPKRRNAGEVAFNVKVPANVAPGIHAVRVLGPSGVSALRLLVVDDLGSVARTPGNDAAAKAQEITVPTAVDGNVDALKAQFFRFQATAGQRLTFEVLARRIGSPLDPTIRLLNARGNELGYSDDEPGLTGDCRMQYEFTEAGEYTLELRDIAYKGGGGHRYRLRIGDFPAVDVPYPMEAQRGTTVDLAFAGPDAANVAPVKLTVSKETALPALAVAAKRADGNGPSGFATLAVSNAPQALEAEPNDDLKTATSVPLGATLHGRLDKDGDVDHFRFTAKKGQQHVFKAITRSQGSATDVFLRVLNAGGQQLSAADDAGTADASITFNPPADGEYVLAVEDLNRRGGPRFAYRVTATPPQPNPFSLSLAADRINVPANGVGIVTVNVARGSHKGAIELTAVDLPAGLTVERSIVAPNLAAGVLAIRATGAKADQYVPLKVVGRATIGGKPVERTATISAPLQAAHAAMPYPPAALARASALAVAPEPPFTLSISGPAIFGKQLAGKLKIVAKRRAGFDEPITLTVEPAKNGLPQNTAAALKPIPKGASEIEVSFNGNQNAPLGAYSAVVRGTLKKGNTNHVQFTAVPLELQRAFAPTVKPAGGVIKKNAELALEVSLGRNPALTQPVTLQVDNLPAGVQLARVSVPSANNTVTLILKAAANAKPAEAKNVTVTGIATVGKVKLTEKSAPFALKVE